MLAVAVNSGFITFPKSFQRVHAQPGLYIWRPEPPKGYVALGCLATPEDTPPSLTDVGCVHSAVCVESHLGQCLPLQASGASGASGAEAGLSVWCVDNVAATWQTSPPSQEPDAGEPPSASSAACSKLSRLKAPDSSLRDSSSSRIESLSETRFRQELQQLVSGSLVAALEAGRSPAWAHTAACPGMCGQRAGVGAGLCLDLRSPMGVSPLALSAPQATSSPVQALQHANKKSYQVGI